MALHTAAATSNVSLIRALASVLGTTNYYDVQRVLGKDFRVGHSKTVC